MYVLALLAKLTHILMNKALQVKLWKPSHLQIPYVVDVVIDEW